MADKNPFSGMKLSEQAGLGKLDQRLFTQPEPTPSPPAPPAPAAEVQLTAPPTDVQIAKPKPAPKKIELTPSRPRFDLHDEALHKATFVFTQEELEALEDLKLELRRDLDQKVTKYDLIRAALHLLLEDHAENKDRSYVRRKIRKHVG